MFRKYREYCETNLNPEPQSVGTCELIVPKNKVYYDNDMKKGPS